MRSTREYGSVTERGELALVRGRAVHRLALDMGARPTWSAAGKGWVVPSSMAADLCAFAEFVGVVVSYKRAEAA